jgi:hypothetical protein
MDDPESPRPDSALVKIQQDIPGDSSVWGDILEHMEHHFVDSACRPKSSQKVELGRSSICKLRRSEVGLEKLRGC